MTNRVQANNQLGWRWLLIVFLVALTPRIAIGLVAPSGGGDTQGYWAVANNIAQNGCVSLDDADAGTCTPSWGGNQLPGFPAFLAAVSVVFGSSDGAVVIAQSILAAISIAYLTHSLGLLTGVATVAVAAGLVVALSPLGIPWARFVLTETLALATTIWVFAELIRSLAEKRLRLVPVAVAYSAAVFMRIDGLLLALPIAFIGFWLHPFRIAILRGLILAGLVTIPVGAWWVRSVEAGLGLSPNVVAVPQGWREPVGYLAWGRTWLHSQYQYPGFDFALPGGAYQTIDPPPTAFANRQEKAQVEALVAALQRHIGESFPADIDDAFGELAQTRIAADPLRFYLWLPLLRMAKLWVNPVNSSGWPVSLDENRGDGSLVQLALEYPVAAVTKVGTAAYRAALMFGAMILGVWAVAKRESVVLPIVVLALVYAIGRTAPLASLALIETRYIVECVPILEVALVVGAWRMLSGRTQSNAASVPIR